MISWNIINIIKLRWQHEISWHTLFLSLSISLSLSLSLSIHLSTPRLLLVILVY